MTSNSSAGRLLARTGALRAVLLLAGLGASFALARVVISREGPDVYATFALIQSVFAVLPFLDFGVGAAVTNAAASADQSRVKVVLPAAIKVTAVSGAVVILTSVVVGSVGAWPTFLGGGIAGHTAIATANLALFAVGLPLSLGTRLLLGGGHQVLLAITQASATPWALVVAASGTFSHSTSTVLLAPGLGLLLSNVLGAFLARHFYRVPIRRREAQPSEIGGVASSAFILSIAMLVSLQSDRIVISHLGSLDDLARYSIVAQLFAPVWLLVAATGQALWSHYYGRIPSIRSCLLTCTSLATFTIFLSLLITILSPNLVAVLSKHALTTNYPLCFFYVITLTVRAFQLPLGMFLTDPEGFRFQALWYVPGAVLNIAASVVLFPRLGISGPVAGTLISSMLFSLAPTLIVVVRRSRGRSMLQGGDFDAATIDSI